MLGKPLEARVVTTGRDLAAYIFDHGLEDALVCIGMEGRIDDTEVVVGYDGEMILVCDNSYYEGYFD